MHADNMALLNVAGDVPERNEVLPFGPANRIVGLAPSRLFVVAQHEELARALLQLHGFEPWLVAEAPKK